jgi:hypothetical protein
MVMDAPKFMDMVAEDILTLIENAEKVLDQKIAAERAELEERRLKLEKLEARRSGKVKKGKSAAAKPRAVNGRAGPLSVAKPSAQPVNGASEQASAT